MGIKKRIADFISSNTSLVGGLRPLKLVFPEIHNTLLSRNNAFRNLSKTKAMPSRLALNLTNICNYSCAFCEIHYINSKFPNRQSNILQPDLIEKYEPWLRFIRILYFYGSTGEPMANKHFADIVEYLKGRYPRIALSVNTNGFFLTADVADKFIRRNFDDVMVSLHAADTATYEKLQGPDFEYVLSNLRYYAEKKKKSQKIGINFMLNRINAGNIYAIVDLVRRLKLDYILVNNYYHVRNMLESKVSFYFDPDKGNTLLGELYAYALKRKIKIFPKNPPYYKRIDGASLECNPERFTVDKEKFCTHPWEQLKMEGCPGYASSHYICVCNRITLLRVNYSEYIHEHGLFKLEHIWNHPVLQFLRETVNTKELNPICRLCKSKEYAVIRCLDNARYRLLRDEAIRQFFKSYRDKYDGSGSNIKGLYGLDSNPYE